MKSRTTTHSPFTTWEELEFLHNGNWPHGGGRASPFSDHAACPEPESRFDMVRNRFFGDCPFPRADGLTTNDDAYFVVYPDEGPSILLDRFQHALDEPRRFAYRLVGAEVLRQRVLLIQYDERKLYLDATLPGHPHNWLLMGLDQIVRPSYELRRYRLQPTYATNVFTVLAPADWRRLEREFGSQRLKKAFEPIHYRMCLCIHPSFENQEHWEWPGGF